MVLVTATPVMSLACSILNSASALNSPWLANTYTFLAPLACQSPGHEKGSCVSGTDNAGVRVSFLPPGRVCVPPVCLRQADHLEHGGDAQQGVGRVDHLVHDHHVSPRHVAEQLGLPLQHAALHHGGAGEHGEPHARRLVQLHTRQDGEVNR